MWWCAKIRLEFRCEEPKPSVLCFDGSVLNAEISVDHDMFVIENE